MRFNHLGVSENRGPWYSALSSRILIIGTPKSGTPSDLQGFLGGSSRIGVWASAVLFKLLRLRMLQASGFHGFRDHVVEPPMSRVKESSSPESPD